MLIKINTKSGFTLIELVVSLVILGIFLIVSISTYFQLSNYSKLSGIRSKTLKDISTVNSMLLNIIKNSYGIVYSETSLDGDLDKIVLWGDKQEKTKIYLTIQQDIGKDVSRIMISKNSDTPMPLHGTSLFIKKINYKISQNPKNNILALEDQPWVSFDIEGRNRSILEKPTEDIDLSLYEKSNISLYGNMVIRNYVPSSLKNN